MSCHHNRHRRHNLQPIAGERSQLQNKLRSPQFRKRYYYNADGLFKLLKFLRKTTLAPGPCLGYIHVHKQESKSPTIPKEEIAPDLKPTKTAQVVVTRIDLCYTNDLHTSRYTTASEGDNPRLLIDRLEVMDWEHTCSRTSGGEKYSSRRSREQMGFGRGDTSSYSGDGWRMEWFPGPDMMDLSYESCRE